MFGLTRRRLVETRPTTRGILVQVAAQADDVPASERVCNQVLAAIQRCDSDVIVDLRHLGVISSSFAAALVLGFRILRQAGHAISVANLPDQARAVFQVYGLFRVLHELAPESVRT